MASAPLIGSYDLLVLGGSAGAAACAIAAARAGRKVLLAAPRSYLGDDVCAGLRLHRPASAPAHPLIDALWPATGNATPLRVKTALDEAVIAAGVDLLLETVPAGVLRDDAGRIAGVLLADRGGRQAVAAPLIVDATRTGAVLRLAGIPAAPLAKESADIAIERILAGPTPLAGEALPELAIPQKEGEQRYAAVRRNATLPWRGAATADLLDLDAAGRLALWDAQALVVSDDAAWAMPVMTAERTWADGRLHALGAWALGIPADPAALIVAGEQLGTRLASQATATAKPVGGGIAGGSAHKNLRAPSTGLRPSAAGGARLPIDESVPLLAEVDVLVVGGGTGGAPAGIAAARTGAKTLVIERLHALGGVGTLGQISVYWHGNRIGFTAEVDAAVHVLGGEPRPRTIVGTSWDTGWKARWWHEALAKTGARTWFGVSCHGVQMEGNRVVGVLVACEHGVGLIRAKSVVDATGAAEIPHLAGAPTVVVGSEHVAVQGTGLADILPGRNYHNSDHTFCDDADPIDATRMFVAGRAKFAGAWDVGQIIDSRERRRIDGEAEISPLDILADRTVPDAVVRASSNFDSHGFTIHPLFLVKPPDKSPLWSWIPYRSLLPRTIDGVLVTGLGMSAHRDALPVVRMQADVQNAGYAAGVAAALAAAAGIGVKAVDRAELQRRLVAAGNLPPEAVGMADSFPVADDQIAWATTAGIDEHRGIALCLAEPERARAGLLAALADPARRERAALLLGILGDAQAAPALRAILADASWDAGWNFTGMGQFGMSMSRIDGLLVALATCGGAEDAAIIARFADALTAEADFSHLRACALAYSTLAKRHPAARPAGASALARLLALPGIGGHAVADLRGAIALARRLPFINDTVSRNESLKELHLAVGLWRCGDLAGAAARTLAAYRSDVRGHYARHASAVLAEGTQAAAAG